MAETQSTSLWRPTNALAALGILILKGLAKLPMPWLLAIGKGVGTVAGLVFPYRRRIGLINLRLCFPEMSEQERRRLLFRHYQAVGMGFFELAAAWYKPDAEFLAMSTITGLEHLDALEQSGRGAIIFTGHFTTLEIIGRVLMCRRRYSCTYRRMNQPVLAREQIKVRSSLLRQMIHFDEVNEFIRCLRKGHLVWYTPDQGKRIKYSEVLPFFGEPAVTNTATARIARAGKAAIIPFMGYRKAEGSYHVDILPENTEMQTDDPVVEGNLLNRQIEAFVRIAPEQYFWLHKRFKNRGEGYPDAYAKQAR